MLLIDELEAAIDKLPTSSRQEIKPILEQVKLQVNRKRRIMSLVQEALAQLRLDMKYLLFDLECTKKERDEARRTA